LLNAFRDVGTALKRASFLAQKRMERFRDELVGAVARDFRRQAFAGWRVIMTFLVREIDGRVLVAAERIEQRGGFAAGGKS